MFPLDPGDLGISNPIFQMRNPGFRILLPSNFIFLKWGLMITLASTWLSSGGHTGTLSSCLHAPKTGMTGLWHHTQLRRSKRAKVTQLRDGIEIWNTPFDCSKVHTSRAGKDETVKVEPKRGKGRGGGMGESPLIRLYSSFLSVIAMARLRRQAEGVFVHTAFQS